jgi:protein-disulfide isomerase
VKNATRHLVLPVREEREHIRGPKKAQVTRVEYGDFECPFCGQAHPVMEAVQRRMGKQMRFVFSHFPLVNAHPHAEAAAEAAEAAGAQHRFWEMHDLLFEHQDALEDGDLLAYAQTVPLDIERFVAEMGAGIHAPRVREDFLGGVRSGVNGTPSFFINGEKHAGSYSYQELAAAIDAHLQAIPAR